MMMKVMMRESLVIPEGYLFDQEASLAILASKIDMNSKGY